MFRPLLIFFFLAFTACDLSAQAAGDYQTVASGNWNTVAVWNTWNGTAWVVPGGTPNNTNGVITINAGHTITIPAALTIDQVIVNGTLNEAAAITVTIANGAGVDLQINGTYGDFSTASVVWNAGATWQMGATGTLIKTTASSSNNWQLNYQGGIATIPATANWIIRKTGAAQPALSTTQPASGSVYPNLTIENNTGAAWLTPAGSSFTGLAAFPTVKGNLDIGGSGTNTVDFLNSNTNASPLLVQGNVTIRAGCNYRNFGTGIEIQGNLVANGSITYDAADARRIVFSGANAQTVSGTGTINIYDLTLNKTSNTVTLNRAITVNNLMTFTGGVMISTITNLLNIAIPGSVTGATNASFVSGPVRYFGSGAFTFPVGKNSDYQPIAIGAFTPGGGMFWTENFGAGCNQNQLPGAYSGVNGAWSTTQPSFNGTSSNDWFISATEAGMGAGNCGDGCLGTPSLTNRTLHVGSKPVGFFCPTGDCGAAYNAGPSGGDAVTDERAESPVINCTGRAGITLSFSYIQTGALPNDAGTVWYYNGAAWSLLASPPATGNAGCLGQGRWTAYSVALPASADNNPNVRIGFRWVNNDDGAGSDPSFAVDDVTLSTAPDYFTAEYFYASPQVAYNNVLAASLNSISACEYWVLDRGPAGSTVSTTVTLAWDGNSCPAIPQTTDARVTRFDGAMWQNEGNGGTTGTTAAGTVISAAAVTTFSPFTIALIPPTPLPVELLRFEGSCAGNAVQLRWTTASEQNNDYFTIERSSDGQIFSTIGTLDGAGNSSQLHHYSFTDAGPHNGTAYYRIRQTDFDGQYSLSKIIFVNTEECADASLVLDNTWFSDGNLQVDYSNAAGPVTLEVYSAEGRLVARHEQLPPQAQYRIPASSWESAAYFVRLTDGVTSVSKTIVK